MSGIIIIYQNLDDRYSNAIINVVVIIPLIHSLGIVFTTIQVNSRVFKPTVHRKCSHYMSQFLGTVNYPTSIPPAPSETGSLFNYVLLTRFPFLMIQFVVKDYFTQ